MLCTSLGLLAASLILMRRQKRILQSSVLPITAFPPPCPPQWFPASSPWSGWAQCEHGSSFLSSLCDQETNPLHFPPLFPGDNLFSISRNILAELSHWPHCCMEGERNIVKVLLLPGAAWFSFGGLLTIFRTFFKPSLIFSLWLYLIQCSLANTYLCTHMLWTLISSPCGKQYVPLSLGPFPSGSLGVFPSSHCLRIQQKPCPPLIFLVA